MNLVSVRSRMRWLFNTLVRQITLIRYPAIRRAQMAVLHHSPQPYYVSAYQAEEPGYWLPIPAWIEQDFKFKTPKRCLDIGCAYGTLAVYSQQRFRCPIYCTDIRQILSPDLIAAFQLTFMMHNIELEPLPWDGLFDLILMTEVLEHLNFHPLPTLKKIAQALSTEGRFYLSTPDAQSWGRQENKYLGVDQIPPVSPDMPIEDRHIYLYDRDELSALVEAAGFQIERFGYAPGKMARHLNLALSKKAQ